MKDTLFFKKKKPMHIYINAIYKNNNNNKKNLRFE